MTDEQFVLPRVTGFSIEKWGPLGGSARIDVSDGITVLVGKNGSGKSLIVEGLFGAARIATGRLSGIRRDTPGRATFNIETKSGRTLQYEYSQSWSRQQSQTSDEPEFHEIELTWNDSCSYLDGNRENVWRNSGGTLFVANTASPIILGPRTTLGIRQSPDIPFELPEEILTVSETLNSIHIVRAAIPQRAHGRRRKIYITSRNSIANDAPEHLARRLVALGNGISEFSDVCRRLHLVKEAVSVHTISGSRLGEPSNDEIDEISVPLFDGINIGLLSDGTLRVVEILLSIVAPPHDARLIMIEEPELAIHPGLISLLLGEIESYCNGKTLIISTHSPQIVSWAKAKQICIVSRSENSTSVRRLEQSEVETAKRYLLNEGTLGDWLFTQDLDEDSK